MKLPLNLKHGDFITCTIDGVQIKNARVSVNKDGGVYICHNSRTLRKLSIPLVDTKGCNNKLQYNYSWLAESNTRYYWGGVKDLRKVKPPKCKPENYIPENKTNEEPSETIGDLIEEIERLRLMIARKQEKDLSRMIIKIIITENQEL